MSIHIRTPGSIVAASTSSQRVQLTNTNARYARVVNGTTALCFVNAGASTVLATSANVALAPQEARTFERDPNNDTYVAVQLSASTGFVSVSAVNESGGGNQG